MASPGPSRSASRTTPPSWWGLKGFERGFPAQLSGGMRQRLEVARALMVKPEVLYMDEPFGSLAALTRLQRRIELRRMRSRQTHTVVLVAHAVAAGRHLADRSRLCSARPARLQCVVDGPCAPPRQRSHPAVVELKEPLLRERGVAEAVWPSGTERRPRRSLRRDTPDSGRIQL
jgi:ABC-type nitrate/sulfonate/bicarbonate transport system ATPase subunit